MCKYFNECLISGNGCQDNCSGDDCDEYLRREKISKKNCPVMELLGKNSQCDILLIKFLVPDPDICHYNGKCIREFCKKVQELLEKHIGYLNKKNGPLIKTELMLLKKRLKEMHEKNIVKGGI